MKELREIILQGLAQDEPKEIFEQYRKEGLLDSEFPELAALVGTQQSPIHHPEGDAWNHTMLVIEKAAIVKGKAVADSEWFMLAALCHDLGKPVVTAYNKEKGKWQAIGHDIEGVPVAHAFLERIGIEQEEQAYVENMVRLHMRPRLNLRNNVSVKTFMHMFDESVCPEDLLLLSYCDAAGRAISSFEKVEAESDALFGYLTEYKFRMAKPFVTEEEITEAGYKQEKIPEILALIHKLRLADIDIEDQRRQIRGVFGKECRRRTIL